MDGKDRRIVRGSYKCGDAWIFHLQPLETASTKLVVISAHRNHMADGVPQGLRIGALCFDIYSS